MSGETDAEKSHEPTQRRLEEMRRQGDVPRSAELTSAAGLLGFTLGLTMSGGGLALAIGDMGITLLGQADRVAPRLLSAQGGLSGRILGGVLMPLIPVFGIPLAMILGLAFVQRSLIMVPSRLAPKLSRISPIATARHRFGREGLVAFARSLAKAALVLVTLGYVIMPVLPELVGRADLDAAPASLWLGHLALRLLAATSALAVVFGGLDWGWQWWLHRQRALMSREELKEEMRDSDGDPHLKAHRRRRGQEIALNKMMAEVKGADVVIVNPTHYAVALKWKRSDRRPPRVVAKGVDDVAARIRARAAESGVPIYSDPPTARALHASVPLGKTIPPDHYRAVAAAIRFAERMRRRAQGWQRAG